MADRSVVDLIEDWQTGFFVVLASAVVGVLVGFLAGSAFGPPGFFFGFLGGLLLAFLGYSYLRYGR